MADVKVSMLTTTPLSLVGSRCPIFSAQQNIIGGCRERPFPQWDPILHFRIHFRRKATESDSGTPQREMLIPPRNMSIFKQLPKLCQTRRKNHKDAI